ncbi:MAG: exodeoxyribonuclease VII large subunit, partial [Chloroflexi bacterium]|nr:exodeoxyribonuclease VII large subunit [Chloroflexota bacterium]
GALEELWPFNEETVARAIYASRVPIISGVGHETDTTISDMVADMRAPTPSAAAEIAVPDATRLQGQVAILQRDAFNSINQQTAQHRQGLEIAVQRLRTASPQVEAWQQRVDELTQALARGLTASLNLARERFAGMERRLASLDPQAVLQRGYAVVQRTADGSVVTSTTQIQSDDELDVTVHDGSFGVRAV